MMKYWKSYIICSPSQDDTAVPSPISSGYSASSSIPCCQRLQPPCPAAPAAGMSSLLLPSSLCSVLFFSPSSVLCSSTTLFRSPLSLLYSVLFYRWLFNLRYFVKSELMLIILNAGCFGEMERGCGLHNLQHRAMHMY